MAEPTKEQFGDGQDNLGQAASKAAEAARLFQEQAAAKGTEMAVNTAAASVQAGLEGGSVVANVAAGTAAGGPWGAAISAAWAMRHTLYKILICICLFFTVIIVLVVALPSIVTDSVFGLNGIQPDPNATLESSYTQMADAVSAAVEAGYDQSLAKVEQIIADGGYDYNLSMDALINHAQSSAGYDVAYILAAYSASLQQKGTSVDDMVRKLGDVGDLMFPVTYIEKEHENLIPVSYCTYKPTTVTVVKVKDLRGYHEDTGEMNQEAFFKFSDYVSSSIPPVKLLRNMQIAADYLATKGIGMIHSVSGVGYTMDLDVDMENWFAKGLNNGLQMRVYFQTMDVKKAKRRKMVRIGGCFDAALDGCFGSADAAMLEPYEGTDSRGVLYYDQEKVNEFCKKANREGMQIEIHAIGDAAFQQATRALKAALDDYPRKDHRHTIIHACLPTEEGIQICKDYKIALAIQSCFIDWPNEPNEYLEALLGERAAKLNPFKTYADNGIVQALGSDGPCTEPEPLMWIHKACNNGDQSLTVQQALKMATYNTYWMSFDEQDRGSLEVGKVADMVILSGNPYETEVTKLDTLKIEQLLLKGEPYQKISQNPIVQVFKGIICK